jgi:AraC-like DNA-binding protein
MEKFWRDKSFNVNSLELSKSDKNFLDRTVKFILENIDNQSLDSKYLYLSLGMSKTPFYSKMKSLTGQSPAEFIKSIKLKLAARILVEEGISIQEVTYRIGMENQSSFSQIFKKQFGKSPSEFIKTYQKS